MHLPLPSAPPAILALALSFPQVVLQPLLLIAVYATIQTPHNDNQGLMHDGEQSEYLKRVSFGVRTSVQMLVPDPATLP